MVTGVGKKKQPFCALGKARRAVGVEEQDFREIRQAGRSARHPMARCYEPESFLLALTPSKNCRLSIFPEKPLLPHCRSGANFQ